MNEEPSRKLSRNETHDLSMIIKDRTKVLRARAEEQAAACMVVFDKKLAAVYSFDQDEVWKHAAEAAHEAVKAAQEIVAKRCEEMGIDTGIDLDALIEVGRMAEEIVGHQLPGELIHAASLDAFRRQAAA